jgi:hypothetical protein
MLWGDRCLAHGSERDNTPVWPIPRHALWIFHPPTVGYHIGTNGAGKLLEGILFGSVVAVLALGLAMVLYGIPVGLCLWLIGRLLGRRVMAFSALVLVLALAWFGLTSHLGCFDPRQCDSPGMILFGPIVYVLVPGWITLTGIMALRVWRDLTR